ncbi:MAG TPA: TetR/AcrR family transcriptional regulator [Mycobacteriales bacterium]|nr:TetR/AcrR family transcriptional regulator [Mycobacteriales bacterium]
MSPATGAASRRDRLRQQTTRDILQTARDLLIRGGPAGIGLRAIARELGMTAPGLYRYFPSLQELLNALITELYGELADSMEQARESAADPVAQLRATGRAFRLWALEHPAEFALLFGTPPPDYELPMVGEVFAQGERVGRVFATVFLGLWAVRPFDLRPDDEVDPGLAGQLRDFARSLLGLPAGAPLPVPVDGVRVALSAWNRIAGLVSQEVFGHLTFALTDVEPMFEAELDDILRHLGF